MAERGGQPGNQNASKGKEFHAALRRAMASDDFARLRKAADRLLDKAAEGEPWAIAELANRLDGKPAQQVSLTGEDGGPVGIQVISGVPRADG
jgi:hypothetical protein